MYFRLGEYVRSSSSNQMHYVWLSGFYFQIYAFASSFLLLTLMLSHDCLNPALTKRCRLEERLWLKVLQFTQIILLRAQGQPASKVANPSVLFRDGVGSCNLTTCLRGSWNGFSYCGSGFSVLTLETLVGFHMHFCCQRSYSYVGA